MSTWKTIIHWPVEAGIPDNRSEDSHESLALAEGVRQMLLRDGLGGERRFFPVKTEVEPVTPYDGKLDREFRNGGKLTENEHQPLDSYGEMMKNHSNCGIAPWQRTGRRC